MATIDPAELVFVDECGTHTPGDPPPSAGTPRHPGGRGGAT
jgi:hypothetical protein